MVLIIAGWDRWNLWPWGGAGQGWCLRVLSGWPEGQWGKPPGADHWQGKLFYVSGSLLWNPHSRAVESHLPHWPHALCFKASL